MVRQSSVVVSGEAAVQPFNTQYRGQSETPVS